MRNLLARSWERGNVHWGQGGGYVAARLWWLVFMLNVLALFTTVPALSNRSTDKSSFPLTASLSHLKQLGFTLTMYAEDNDGRLPPMSSTVAAQQALDKYLASYDAKTRQALWRTPRLDVPYAVNPSLSLRLLRAYPNPARVVAIWDTRVWSGESRVVAFLDGHAKAVPQSEWDVLRVASGIVRDAPVPAEPSWWSTRIWQDKIDLLSFMVPLGACVAAFLAAWREAWCWAGERKEGVKFWLAFVCWLLVRLLGHSFCVAFAAIVLTVGVAWPRIVADH